MRSVSWNARIGVLALLVVLLTPSAIASNTPPAADPTLWDEFVLWWTARIDIPNGAVSTEDEFSLWLMIRIHIPNG
jgi:hypothetical protein